jgi:hypothetical protein
MMREQTERHVNKQNKRLEHELNIDIWLLVWRTLHVSQSSLYISNQMSDHVMNINCNLA